MRQQQPCDVNILTFFPHSIDGRSKTKTQGLKAYLIFLPWYLSFALPFLGTSKSTPEMIPIIHLKLVIYDLQLRKERKEFASHHSLRSLGGNLSMEKYSRVSNNRAIFHGVVPFTFEHSNWYEKPWLGYSPSLQHQIVLLCKPYGSGF